MDSAVQRVIGALILFLITHHAHALTLPIEVLGTEGTIESAVVPVPRGGSARRLYLVTHGVNRAGKASVRINGGAWIDLRNDNSAIQVLGAGGEYGGIGGGFQSLKMTVEMPAGAARDGDNTISFRFNEDYDRSSGYRILELNLLDNSGSALIPQTEFSQEDPSRWTAPRSSTADIAEGKRLWSSAPLTKTVRGGAMSAFCSDCHAREGQDLKYYNYSNRSIVERSKFHGLSQTQGEQIASYIRSLDFPNPGRPWNPPYQPGPGLDAKPVREWAAGAGLAAVIETDKELAEYLPTEKSDHMDSNRFIFTYNRREIPMKLQFLDWNHWLPEVHPKDSLGRDQFLNHNANRRYQEIVNGLEGRRGMTAEEYIKGPLREEIDRWKNSISGDDDREPIMQDELGGDSSSSSYRNSYDAVLWQIVKLWEIVNQYNLQELGEQFYGVQGEKRFWPSNRLVFNAGPHIFGIRGGDRGFRLVADSNISAKVDWEFVTNFWYTLQTLLNGGQRSSVKGGHHDVDWKYNFYFDGTGSPGSSSSDSGRTTSVMESLIMAWKGIQELDSGFGPEGPDSTDLNHNAWWGWAVRDGRPEIGRWQSEWKEMSRAEIRTHLKPLYSVWIEKLSSFDREQWAKTNFDFHRPLDYRWGTRADDSYPDEMKDSIAWLRQNAEMDETILSAYADLGKYMYPNNDWDSLKRQTTNEIAPPQGVRAEPAAGAVVVSWNPVSGASSYNVKRSDSRTGVFRSVALQVSGNSFRDPLIKPGKSYFYRLSADRDGTPTTDSEIVGPVSAGTGLVLHWKFNETQGNFVTDGSGSSVWGKSVNASRTNGKYGAALSLDGSNFASSSINLCHFINRDSTMTAWIRTSSQGANDIERAPALMGSIGDPSRSESLIVGSLGADGRLGVRYWDGGNVVRSTRAINDGAWHHVAFTRRADNGGIAIYVDGVRAGEGTSGSGERVCRFFSVGRADALSPQRGRDNMYWNGAIDAFRIYNRVLSEVEISGVMNDSSGETGGNVSPTPIPSATATPRPSATATPTPTATPKVTPTATPRATATPTRTPVATATPRATATTAPTRTPVTGGAVSRAVDVNGGDSIIDGMSWKGQGNGGIRTSGENQSAPNLVLSPVVSGAKAEMLRTFVGGQRARVTFSDVSKGKYEIYVYFVEPEQSRTFSVFLQGRRVVRAVRTGAQGSWQRVGGWKVTMDRRGAITLRTSGARAHIAGIELRSLG